MVSIQKAGRLREQVLVNSFHNIHKPVRHSLKYAIHGNQVDSALVLEKLITFLARRISKYEAAGIHLFKVVDHPFDPIKLARLQFAVVVFDRMLLN